MSSVACHLRQRAASQIYGTFSAIVLLIDCVPRWSSDLYESKKM